MRITIMVWKEDIVRKKTLFRRMQRSRNTGANARATELWVAEVSLCPVLGALRELFFF
jgi:hypothetical protein